MVVWEPVKDLYSLILQVHWSETPLGGRGGGVKVPPKILAALGTYLQDVWKILHIFSEKLTSFILNPVHIITAKRSWEF